MTSVITQAKQYSEKKLSELRCGLATLVIPKDDIVLTCGSYARREASKESDCDSFVITPHEISNEPPIDENIKNKIKDIVPIDPSLEGPFWKVESQAGMLVNIGGDQDSNPKLTRRMLLLLEGEWLFNEGGLAVIRRKILERYIREDMADHQLARFLLNDIIRYYRTIAIDYEFKTGEGDNPKPWGIRNIKLVFSRKLLYASGLFSVAMTAGRTRDQKIEILENLFGMSAIDRLIDICGLNRVEGILKSYSLFLESLENSETRNKLKKIRKEERSDSVFRNLKNEGHHFTGELLKLFEGTFDSTHPIRRAVIF